MLSCYNFIFIDINETFANEINKQFNGISNVVGLKMKVEEYKSTNKIFYVSPANSFGFMDGGIDKIYSRRMFREVEDRVTFIVKAYGKLTKLGRKYMPIGSAFIVPADTSYMDMKHFIISAPTMLLPQNVEHTNNAYYAFLAVLNVITTFNMAKGADIVIPGLCTGYGGLSYEKCVQQILKAYIDYEFGTALYKNILFRNNFIFMSEPNLSEQPNEYQNSEFKLIS